MKHGDAGEHLWLKAGATSEQLSDPDFRHLFEYWQSAARGHPAPRREDVDPPVDLPRYLPTTLMFDVERPSEGRLIYRYRLVGTELTANAGQELRGQSIEEVFTADAIREDLAIFERVVGETVCYFGQRISMIPDRERFESYARLVMPLLGPDTGQVEMLWVWIKLLGLRA